MAKLTPEQKNIIRLIEKEAIAAGVDPYFAIALANLESTFRHVPAQVAEGEPASTSFGPFQVNKATAAANGVDYEEMKNNPELAVRTGIMNIARHAKNPNLMTKNPETGVKEIDPARIAAAHRYGENSEYAKTGNRAGIDEALKTYLRGVAEHYDDRDFPQTILTKPAETTEATQTSTDGEIDMGSIPPPDVNLAKIEQADRHMSAEHGLEAGALFGAVKAPVFSAGHRLYEIAKNLGKGNPSSQDLLDIAEAAARVNQQNVNVSEVPEVPDTQVQETSGGKYRSKTGYGKGEGSTRAVISREELESPKGKFSKKIYKHNRAVEAVKESDEAIRLAQEEAQRIKMLAQEQERQAILRAQHQQWQDSVNAAKRTPNWVQQVKNTGNAVADVGRSVINSAPVKFGLGGLGAVYNLVNADQQFSHGTDLGNAAGFASLGGATAFGAAPFLKNAARVNPAGIAFTTAGQVLGDIDRGDYDSAKASGYLGALGLANPAVAVGSLLPTGLNRNEEEELARRRKMPPTISP